MVLVGQQSAGRSPVDRSVGFGRLGPCEQLKSNSTSLGKLDAQIGPAEQLEQCAGDCGRLWLEYEGCVSDLFGEGGHVRAGYRQAVKPRLEDRKAYGFEQRRQDKERVRDGRTLGSLRRARTRRIARDR